MGKVKADFMGDIDIKLASKYMKKNKGCLKTVHFLFLFLL